MAVKEWTGAAAAVAQITSVTYSSVAASETYSITINGKTVEVESAGSSAADLIEALVAQWNSSPEPEHQEMIASEQVSPAAVILTGREPGVPYTVTAAATDGTATVASVRAATGPNHWTAAGNWSGGTVPANGDDLIIRDGARILYSLDDAAKNYDSVRVSGDAIIGLPRENSRGYIEYRPLRLRLGSATNTTALTIGSDSGRQPQLIRIEIVGAVLESRVFGAEGTGLTDFSVELIGGAAGSTHEVYAGRVVLSGGTIDELTVIAAQAAAQPPEVRVAAGMTFDTARVFGGQLITDSGGDVLEVRTRGRAWVRSGSWDEVTVASQGYIGWQSDGDVVTKLVVEQGGDFDLSVGAGSVDVEAADVYAASSLRDPLSRVTWTNGVQLVGASLTDLVLDLGPNRKVEV